MFKFEKENYKVKDEEDKLFYDLMFGKVYGIYSPFEVDSSVEFPKKDELGGIVLKFIGGGSAYFKVQREMPSKEEVNSIFEVCKFLQKEFGQYVVSMIHCEPHIEIRDIEVPGTENIDIHFVSSRKNDGNKTLKRLTKKLETNQEFTIDDVTLKFMLPFMSRKDDDEFQAEYFKFIDLYNEKNLDLPDIKDLSRSGMIMNRIF